MLNRLLQPVLPVFLAIGMAAFIPACGDKDDADTDETGDDDDDDDDATGDDDDDDDLPTTGFARVVNLITDPTSIDITLNDADDPLIVDLPQGGNTDATGDYVGFPPGSYNVRADYDGEELATLAGAEVEVGEYYTVLFYGSQQGGAVSPTLGPDATVIVDNVHNTMMGMHHLWVHHYAPGIGELDILIDGEPSIDGLGYTGRSNQLMTDTGTQTLGIDVDGDGATDHLFELELADNEWSYVYILPSPVGFTVLHHQRGVEMQVAPQLDQ